MKEVFYAVLLVVGLAIGWFVNDWLKPEPTEKIHLTLEQATKQSKFNLARDDMAEYFYICQEKGLGINHWKALFLTGYSFQYGVDSSSIALKKASPEGETPEKWNVEVSSLDVLSSEIKMMKAFTLDRAWFKNHEKLISKSKDELISRKNSLAIQRLYGDPNQKIAGLLEDSIRDTIVNLSKALGKNVEINSIKLPDPPENWDENLNLSMKYQCGDINPVFEGKKGINKSLETLTPSIDGLEVIVLPTK
ncbi:hypothetical protein GCM10009098_03420 [Rheinheimera aquimaris]|uniref:Uncharacterized protein n=1 Tax=Rheinheimera aquimaris TaxID=412437 RepID=A0ABN1DB92_9GAMM|nr:hypothetical protein [Rheinheimera aquimaris]MCB5212480.1 hypothetical protein [Rheinheimera aquimaris]